MNFTHFGREKALEMNAADRLQMFANSKRATQHLLWEKVGQDRLRNLLESIERQQRDGEWADVRPTVQRMLMERAGASGTAMLAACRELAKEAEELKTEAYGQLLDMANGADTPRIVPPATPNGARRSVVWG